MAPASARGWELAAERAGTLEERAGALQHAIVEDRARIESNLRTIQSEVERGWGSVERRFDEARDRLGAAREAAERAFDWRATVRRHPLRSVLACAGLGFALGGVFRS